jgi:CRISP-associated protein Cas1
MLRQVVEISEEGTYLSAYRGFLKISKAKEKLAEVPLDDIAVLLVTARGVSFSKEILTRINERGGMAILCGKNYNPASFLLPYSSHFEYTGRLLDQIAASQPLKKQMWKTVVQAKIRNQASVLSFYKKNDYKALIRIADQVKSGDKENNEAYAARLYWKSLFEGAFKRDTNEPGINSLLNYGYGVLRGMTARAVCSAGLQPALGIHHINRSNNMCLVDDLMEIYRPLFDIAAVEISKYDEISLIPENKKKIIQLCWLDLESDKGRTPLIKALEDLSLSVVRSFKEKINQIIIPPFPGDGELTELVESCF